MATSGTMYGTNRPISGNESRFIVNWQLSSQSENNNNSTINWQAKWRFVNNDRQLDDGDTTINNSLRWNNSGRLKNYTADFSTRDHQLASGSFTIPHNSDGTKTFNINGSTLGYLNERSSGSANFTLPSLYQEIAFNTYTLTTVSDIALSVYVSVNRTADLLQLSIDGGAWTTYYSGNFTTKTVTVGGASDPLISDREYSVKVRVRRDSNANLTESSTKYATTETQNKFFGIGDY